MNNKLFRTICIVIVCVLAILNFVLSYSAIQLLVYDYEMPTVLGYIYPLVVDLAIVGFGLYSVLYATESDKKNYTVAMLSTIAFIFITLVMNILSSIIELGFWDWTSVLIAVCPPAALALTTHMLIIEVGRSNTLPPSNTSKTTRKHSKRTLENVSEQSQQSETIQNSPETIQNNSETLQIVTEQFKCDKCGKEFANGQALGGHKGKSKCNSAIAKVAYNGNGKA